MVETTAEEVNIGINELREITLRIPGEFFFCETIRLPAQAKIEDFYEIAQLALEEDHFSPYPAEQLAWGFNASLEEGKMLLFACPFSKLKQLGWQNLEMFRRVFPSFVSLFGKQFKKPTIAFLLHENSLTAASFEALSSIPDLIFSLPIDLDDKESLDQARGKLLSLMDLEHFEVQHDVLIAGEVNRSKDGYFQFEHEWMEGKDPELELEQDVSISAEELWDVDLRPLSYKFSERKRRKQARMRWKGVLIWSFGMVTGLIAFLGIKILGIKLNDQQMIAGAMANEVPLVIESQKLLEKLKQNKLGGIDPFGALGRVAVHRGGSGDQPDLWFSQAHFDSRNEVKLEGEGKTVEAINTFIEELKINGVAKIIKEQKKSGGGKTTFKVELELIEVEETIGMDSRDLDSNLTAEAGK